MPIQDHFPIPASTQDLPVANDAADKLFVCFISSTDPATQQAWCPDVRAALPRLEKVFSGQEGPKLAYVHVGQKPEWKVPDNVYRKDWGLKAIPTLIRYQRVNGEVTATGQLVETEVSDEEKLVRFVKE